MNYNELELIGHSLGVNVYHAKTSKLKKDKKLPNKFYRNYFCAGTENHDDYPVLFQLYEKGFMDKWEKFGNIIFSVTDEGIKEFSKQFNLQVNAH